MMIYKATNKQNGKIYIGKTTKKLNERKCIHEWNAINNGHGYKSKFYNAIRKYGVESFVWEIIEDQILTAEELVEKEKLYIKNLKSIENGYNISEGGLGGDNFTNNPNKEAIRLKISKSHAGKKMSKEFCIKNRERQIGIKRSPETIEKMKLAHKGKRVSQETREKIRKTLTGRKMPEETKTKISITTTGRKLSEEHRKNIGLSHIGIKRKFVPLKKEHKEKIREALIGRTFSQAHKDKLKLAWQKRKFNEEKNRNSDNGGIV